MRAGARRRVGLVAYGVAVAAASVGIATVVLNAAPATTATARYTCRPPSCSAAPPSGPITSATRALASSVSGDDATRTTTTPSPPLVPVSTANWNTYVTDNATAGAPWNPNGAGGSGATPGVFDEEYFSPAHVVQADGVTRLIATPGSSQPGYEWTSGVLSSYGHFTFSGGYIQVEAKIPNTTDGAYPSIWLLSGPGNSATEEIDIFEGGLVLTPPASDDVNDNFGGFIHLDGVEHGDVVDVGTDLSAGYNTYGIDWVPGRSITWYFNGHKVMEFTSATATIPSGPMEVIEELAIASPAAAAWHTVSQGMATTELDVRGIETSSQPPR